MTLSKRTGEKDDKERKREREKMIQFVDVRS